MAPVRPENRLVFISGKYVEYDGLDVIVPEKYCDNTVTTTKVCCCLIIVNDWQQKNASILYYDENDNNLVFFIMITISVSYFKDVVDCIDFIIHYAGEIYSNFLRYYIVLLSNHSIVVHTVEFYLQEPLWTVYEDS